MIDLGRLELLINGNDTPRDLGEEMFLAGYIKSSEGILLFNFLLELEETLDNLTLDEIHLMVLGYAMGQHDLETTELALLNDDSKVH